MTRKGTDITAEYEGKKHTLNCHQWSKLTGLPSRNMYMRIKDDKDYTNREIIGIDGKPHGNVGKCRGKPKHNMPMVLKTQQVSYDRMREFLRRSLV